MNKLWEVAVAVCGVSGVALLVVWSIYRQSLNLKLYHKLNQKQSYKVIMTALVLVFLAAIAVLAISKYFDAETARNRAAIDTQSKLIDEKDDHLSEQRDRLADKESQLTDIRSVRENLEQQLKRMDQLTHRFYFDAVALHAETIRLAETAPDVVRLSQQIQRMVKRFEAEFRDEDLSKSDRFDILYAKAVEANANRMYTDACEILTEEVLGYVSSDTDAQITREVSARLVKGQALIGQLKWSDGIQCFRRVIAIQPSNSWALHCMAICLKAQQRVTESRDYLNRAIAINEVADPAGVSVATDTMLLGILEAESGTFEAAELALERSLDIWLRLPGYTDPNLATLQASLGIVCYNKRDIAKCSYYALQAMDSMLRIPPTQWSENAYNIANLGMLICLLGHAELADKLVEQAIRIIRPPDGKTEHPDLGRLRLVRGHTLLRRGESEQAAKQILQGIASLSIANRDLVASGVIDLAECNLAEGELVAGKRLLTQAISITADAEPELFQPISPAQRQLVRAAALRRLAMLEYESCNLDQAVSLMRSASDLYEQSG